MEKELLEKLLKIIDREVEIKSFRVFALIPERDELSTNISTKELIKLIKKYNDLIFSAKEKHFNENFLW